MKQVRTRDREARAKPTEMKNCRQEERTWSRDYRHEISRENGKEWVGQRVDKWWWTPHHFTLPISFSFFFGWTLDPWGCFRRSSNINIRLFFLEQSVLPVHNFSPRLVNNRVWMLLSNRSTGFVSRMVSAGGSSVVVCDSMCRPSSSRSPFHIFISLFWPCFLRGHSGCCWNSPEKFVFSLLFQVERTRGRRKGGAAHLHFRKSIFFISDWTFDIFYFYSPQYSLFLGNFRSCWFWNPDDVPVERNVPPPEPPIF